MDIHWDNWLERLYNLRRDKTGSHERPHKPVLLLSIIDLLDRGVLTRNEAPLDDELIRTFKRYFEVVRKHNDKPTIENPYFHLCGDNFWRLVPAPGKRGLYQPGAAAGAPSVAELRRRTLYGTFDDGLWRLLSEPMARHQLREALIARYFPDDRDPLAAVAATSPEALEPAELELERLPERDAAFRRTILDVYDYRCAACGVRVLHQSVSLVVAAHLIPFAVSRNDKPTNGMALCPNHHWAMDQHLIAPVPDPERKAGIWRVNERLDDRIEGQRELIAIAGKAVIPPGEEKFYPAPESLQWRAAHLGDG
ncbi:MAG TPA: HNH endonuclease [Verrucomicrobiae bacterium]|nr:HNH endonuclease [Verrucomicrobiae bacterium]